MASKDNNTMKYTVIGIAVLVLICFFIFLRGEKKVSGISDDDLAKLTTYPYIEKKAAELSGESGKMLAFVKGLKTPAYSGEMRGALGTLWAQAGSVEDKKVLLGELLRHSELRKDEITDVLSELENGGGNTVNGIHRLQIQLLYQKVSERPATADKQIRYGMSGDKSTSGAWFEDLSGEVEMSRLVGSALDLGFEQRDGELISVMTIAGERFSGVTNIEEAVASRLVFSQLKPDGEKIFLGSKSLNDRKNPYAVKNIHSLLGVKMVVAMGRADQGWIAQEESFMKDEEPAYLPWLGERSSALLKQGMLPYQYMAEMDALLAEKAKEEEISLDWVSPRVFVMTTFSGELVGVDPVVDTIEVKGEKFKQFNGAVSIAKQAMLAKVLLNETGKMPITAMSVMGAVMPSSNTSSELMGSVVKDMEGLGKKFKSLSLEMKGGGKIELSSQRLQPVELPLKLRKGMYVKGIVRSQGKEYGFDARVTSLDGGRLFSWSVTAPLTMKGSVRMSASSMGTARNFCSWYPNGRLLEQKGQTSLWFSRAMMDDLFAKKEAPFNFSSSSRIQKTKTIKFEAMETYKVKVNGRMMDLPVIRAITDRGDVFRVLADRDNAIVISSESISWPLRTLEIEVPLEEEAMRPMMKLSQWSSESLSAIKVLFNKSDVIDSSNGIVTLKLSGDKKEAAEQVRQAYLLGLLQAGNIDEVSYGVKRFEPLRFGLKVVDDKKSGVGGAKLALDKSGAPLVADGTGMVDLDEYSERLRRVYLFLDKSGSMQMDGHDRWRPALQAIEKGLESMEDDAAVSYFLYLFSGSITKPWVTISADTMGLRLRSLADYKMASDGTNFSVILNQLAKDEQQLVNGVGSMAIIVTDGEVTTKAKVLNALLDKIGGRVRLHWFFIPKKGVEDWEKSPSYLKSPLPEIRKRENVTVSSLADISSLAESVTELVKIPDPLPLMTGEITGENIVPMIFEGAEVRGGTPHTVEVTSSTEPFLREISYAKRNQIKDVTTSIAVKNLMEGCLTKNEKYSLIVPSEPIDQGGVKAIAWYHVDNETGVTQGLLGDGSRGAVIRPDNAVTFRFVVKNPQFTRVELMPGSYLEVHACLDVGVTVKSYKSGSVHVSGKGVKGSISSNGTISVGGSGIGGTMNSDGSSSVTVGNEATGVTVNSDGAGSIRGAGVEVSIDAEGNKTAKAGGLEVTVGADGSVKVSGVGVEVKKNPDGSVTVTAGLPGMTITVGSDGRINVSASKAGGQGFYPGFLAGSYTAAGGVMSGVAASMDNEKVQNMGTVAFMKFLKGHAKEFVKANKMTGDAGFNVGFEMGTSWMIGNLRQ